MSVEFRFDGRFRADYTRLKKRIPSLASELDAALTAIQEEGHIPEWYNPHRLENSNGRFTGCWDFHLFEGKADVVVIYIPIDGGAIIRFVRMGGHKELFA